MLPRRLLLALILSGATSLAAESEAFEQALESGKSLLDRGDLSAAQTKLQEATLANPDNFEGYFYLAVASYRKGDFTAAAEYADLALARAPEGEKGQIGEMINVIAHRREAEDTERQGEEALAKGLRAKAADLFRQAYELSPRNGPVGLKAAALYADTLKRLLEAAALWRKIAANADEASAGTAHQELTRRTPELEKLFNEQLDGAQALLNKDDTSTLERLIEIFPDRWEPHLALGAYLVDEGKYEEGVEHLGRASALGIDLNQIKFNKRLVWTFNRDNADVFRTFIEDAFGSEVSAHLKDMPFDYAGADTPEKQEMYREAIRQGHMWAAVSMADAFLFGFHAHAPENPTEAIRLYRLAADAGDGEGLYKMGNIYLRGYNVDADPAQAARYLRAGVAKGNDQAMTSLGEMHAKGIGMAVNETEALRLWKEAADLGNWSAIRNLANFYASKKSTEAIPWAKKMAESDASFIAMDGWHVLGLCQRDGIGGPVDLAEARRLLTKATELGSRDAKQALAQLP
ncbi:hypothetical protein MASR2M8_20030 [Opitutaceae bacterium]